jgi:hypothetical protein
MTREEREKAIKALKWFKEYNEEDYCGGDRIQDEHGDWYYRITEQDLETFDMIIKALEQEPILDKIRAEIDKIYNREGNSFDCLNALDELKEFIDKYKAESEG